MDIASAVLFRKLAEERCLAGLPAVKFSQRAAHYFGELNALHPFREGNGRAQREFLSHLALGAGFYIAWENVRQAAMLKASIESFKGKTSELVAIISENLTSRDGFETF